MRFRTVIQLNGKTATGIQVPPDVVERLGSGKRPAVRVTINGYTYRSTVAVMGGQYMLPVSAEVRAGAHVAAGEEIDVDLELDTEKREVDLPPELAEALAADSSARQRFESLSFSRKRELALSVESAKTPETRQRRLDKALETLRSPDA